jgi:glycosyltransferase involved in cell wall biosynthesis
MRPTHGDDETATAEDGAKPPLRIEAFLTLETAPIAATRMIDPLRLADARPDVSVRLTVLKGKLKPFPDGRGAVALFYRSLTGKPGYWPLLRELHHAGYLIVTDVDDLMWDGSGGSFDDAWWAQWAAPYKQSDYVAHRGVHAIQASTPVLAEELRRFNPAVRVFPATVGMVPPLRPRPDGPVRLLFAGLNRSDGWRAILEPLNRVLDRRPDVEVVTLNDQEFHDALRTGNKTFQSFQPYARYLDTLDSCHLALAPLADSRFNRAKSDLKFVECAARGVAMLASDVVYADTVEDGVTGLIYRTPEEFETALERLLDDAALRDSLTRAAHAWVARERRLQDGVDARIAWYRELLAEKPRLDAGIRDRAGWILDPDGRPPVAGA